MLSVYFGCAVCLQFEMGGGTRRRFCFWWLFRLMISPLDPVATKLGQKDEWKWPNSTKHLIGKNKRAKVKTQQWLHLLCIKGTSTISHMYLMDAWIRNVVLFCLQGEKQMWTNPSHLFFTVNFWFLKGAVTQITFHLEIINFMQWDKHSLEPLKTIIYTETVNINKQTCWMSQVFW